MNEIIRTVQAATSPVPLSGSSARKLAFFRTKIETTAGVSSISADSAPTVDERAGLARREERLAAWLAPAGEKAILPHISSLMLSMHHKSEDEEARTILQRIWAADLADLPLFAVERACADFRQGRAGDGKWLPTQAEVRRVALQHAEKLRKEHAEVRAVLTARVVEKPRDEAERKRIADEARAEIRKAAAKADVAAGEERAPR
jgi:hypothetical protein